MKFKRKIFVIPNQKFQEEHLKTSVLQILGDRRKWENIIITMYLKGMWCKDSAGSTERSVTGSREHNNKILRSIKEYILL